MEFPVPEFTQGNEEEKHISPAKNDENSTTANNENPHLEISAPMETPSKKPIAANAFETPNVRNASRLDALYMSGIKKPRYEAETPSKKISRKELNSFINRTEKAEEMRKKKQEDLKHQEEVRLSKITATTKKLSRKEIEKLSNRLSQTPCRNTEKKTATKKSMFLPQATPAPTSHVFNRLYLQSTCKKRFDEDEEEQLYSQPKVTFSSSISAKSSNLASKHSIQKIAEVFGSTQFCTYDEMLGIFRSLSIIDEMPTDHELAIVEKEIEKCKTNDDTYNACQMKEMLIECFISRKQTKFSRFVSSKMALARANERAVIKTEEAEEDPEEVKCAAKMQKETLERLLNSKPVEVVVEEEPVVQTKALSNASKSILAKSERTKNIADLSLNERDKLLLQKRDELVSKLKETIEKEEESKMKAPTNLGALPDFYDKLPEDKKHRTKKTEEPDNDATYRPKINSYEEYKKKIAKEPKIKPSGWDQTVERIKLGRLERNRIQAALDIRNSDLPVKKPQTKRNKFAEWKQRVSKRGQRQLAAEAEADAAPLSEVAEVDNVLGI